jgi:hypothetical protein
MTMKNSISFALAAALLAMPALSQEGPKQPRILVDKPGLSALTDDDDGRVEVYRRGESDRALEFHGGATIHQPIIQLVFLGTNWSDDAKRALQAKLEKVTMPDNVQPAVIAGARQIEAPQSVNDLKIQSVIDRAMRDGVLPMRDDNAIYIIFLGSNMQSTLGDHKPAHDYDSYHSHFNAHDTNVRYVVVPFDENAAAMGTAAAKSTLRAVINPDGDGWY